MKQIILCIFISLLYGCAPYRSYIRPNISTENIFGDMQGLDSSTLATTSWQHFFTDSCLQTLITKGLENNTDLRIARLRVEAAQTVLSNARLSYLPSISLNADGAATRFDGSTTKTYNLATAASWEVDIFGKVTNAKIGARASLESSKAYEQAVKMRLVASIANSYYTLLMLDNQFSISQQTLENWKDMQKSMELLTQAGKSNDIAVLQAKASIAALQAAILSTDKQIKETENMLSAIFAQSPQTIKRGDLQNQEFPATLSVGFPIQLLSNRPDVKQAEYDLAQAFYATNAARLAFYPNVTLSGTLGWTNNGGGTILNPGSWLLNAIGSLTQPLFNRGMNHANLKIAQTKQQEALLLFQQSIINAGMEVNNALTQVQTAQRRSVLNQQQAVSLQEAVRKTELLMRHSSTNYLEVLIARQTLLNARQSEIADRFEEIQGMINLYNALGGGW